MSLDPTSSMALPVRSDDLDELVGLELRGSREAASYRLDRVLGGGGQAVVFLATRRVHGREDTVVVKVWRPSFVGPTPEIAALVRQKESVALARLGERVPPTPFVVRLLDGGELDVLVTAQRLTLPWLALEHVHGGALGGDLGARVAESVRTNGTGFSPARARRVLYGVVEGMIAIHEAGVVHRDLKPTNVLVCGAFEAELAKVADFGLARPAGLVQTFGDAAVGTPGYGAPEQMDGARVGPWSDVFSLGAVAFFVIAGEDMFQGPPMVRLAHAYKQIFEPLASRPHVHPDFRHGTVLARLEAVLRAATRPELHARIASVFDFWVALDPILREAESAGTIAREIGSAATLSAAASEPWSFHETAAPSPPLELRAVAFDPDGHALAAGRRGLWYWEGARWMAVTPPPGVAPERIRVLRRLGPERWFAAGDDGRVLVFSPRACAIEQTLFDGRAALTAAGVASERDFALALEREGSPPLLVAFHDGAFTKPLVAVGAAAITDLAPEGDGAWLVSGRDAAGKGWLASYRADRDELTPWPVDCAPLLASAVDDRDRAAYLVGAGGFAFRKAAGHPTLERAQTHRDLTACAVDPAGAAWAVAIGRVLRRPPGRDAGTWSVAWTSTTWSSPFVALGAMPGRVLAASADGGVVTGRQSTS
jgi:serine/threonine protein kinase